MIVDLIMREKLNDTSQGDYEMKPLGSAPVLPLVPPRPAVKESSVSWLKYLLILALAIIIKILQPLAIANSKEGKKYRYNESVMVLVVEFVKLIFCSAVFYGQYRSTPREKRAALHDLPLLQSLHFLVPAVLYAISNTLVYYGISYINPALFHVFGNTRILIAGFLYRCMMHKKQTDIQWLSLFLIAFGAILSKPPPDEEAENENYLLGLFFVATMSLCSTSASIYTEKYYKKTQELSVFYQNIVLYIYGIIVNSVVVLLTLTEEKGFFAGFDRDGLMVLLVQSVMGISLSFIFKYLDNIVYVISLTVSMFITAIISAILFDFHITVSFISAMAVVTIGIYFFYRDKVFERFKVKENGILV